MKKTNTNRDDSVKTGLTIEAGKNTAANQGQRNTALIPEEKDEDDLVHEKLEEQSGLIEPTEQDMDDLMHSQRPKKHYDRDEEQDIDDLLHEPSEPEDEQP